MKRLAWAALAFCCGAIQAQDAPLAALRATILSLREHPNDHRDTRGATPALTMAKHQLRDWIESRLAGFPSGGDEAVLAEQLHAGLRDFKLFCDDDRECFPSNLGYLDEIRVNREQGFLVVRTAVGIWCGYDYSAYIYQASGGHWQRIWEDEHNTYTKTGYLPQMIHEVRITEPDASGSRLLLTLGSRPGCALAFPPVYYRVWRVRPGGAAAKLLLDGSETVNDDGYPPVHGTITLDDVRIGFTAGGTGYGSSHKAVRHFQVRGDKVTQVDPIAETPRDFVEEWLSGSWKQSGPRSESPSLRQWHAKLHRDDGMGDFPDPPMQCSSSPELWQIATHLHDAPKLYYLVRWKQPYKFTMVGISEGPLCASTATDERK